jgi:hypothetical protein
VWLQNPDILNDTAQCKEVFSIIFERFKLKTLSSSTKARIIQTFIKFLDLYSDKMREEHDKDLSFTLLMIQKELSQFVHLLDSKDHAVRASVAEMIIKIDELGLLPLIDGAKIFIKMLNDCNTKTIKAASLALKKIAHKKLSLVVVCATPADMILESYRYQKLIYKHPKLQLTSGFVKILDVKMNQLTYWNNIGIFDDLLEFLNQNDENVIHSLVKSLIKFIEDPHNYLEFVGDIHFINFFAQVLFNTLKVGKGQAEYQELLTSYLYSHEVLVYENIKQALCKDTLVQDKSLYPSGFLLLIIKLG